MYISKKNRNFARSFYNGHSMSREVKNKLLLFAHQWGTPFFCAGLWFFGYWLVRFLYETPSSIVEVAWIFIVFFLEVVVTFFDMFVGHPNAKMRAKILIPIAALLLFVAGVIAVLFHVSEQLRLGGEEDAQFLPLTIAFALATLIKFMQVWLPNNFPSYMVEVEVAQSGGVYKRNYSALGNVNE